MVRESIQKAHLWVASNIYEAFCEAKDLAIEGTDARRFVRVLEKDYWAYGLQPNRSATDAAGRYVYGQGLSPRAVNADQMFLDLQ